MDIGRIRRDDGRETPVTALSQDIARTREGLNVESRLKRNSGLDGGSGRRRRAGTIAAAGGTRDRVEGALPG